MKEAGYRTRRGAKWSGSTVSRLLQDPTAKGWRRANHTKRVSTAGHWELKPEEEWVWVPVEPVVSEELWDQCNAILEERRRSVKRWPAKKAKQLFAGFTFCHCGRKMYVPSNTPKYVCWDCRNKIPITDLEAVFHEQLNGFVFSSEEVAQVLQDADQTIIEKQELLGTLEGEKKRVE